jgi:hypothetical protein
MSLSEVDRPKRWYADCEHDLHIVNLPLYRFPTLLIMTPLPPFPSGPPSKNVHNMLARWTVAQRHALNAAILNEKRICLSVSVSRQFPQWCLALFSGLDRYVGIFFINNGDQASCVFRATSPATRLDPSHAYLTIDYDCEFCTVPDPLFRQPVVSHGPRSFFLMCDSSDPHFSHIKAAVQGFLPRTLTDLVIDYLCISHPVREKKFSRTLTKT